MHRLLNPILSFIPGPIYVISVYKWESNHSIAQQIFHKSSQSSLSCHVTISKALSCADLTLSAMLSSGRRTELCRCIKMKKRLIVYRRFKYEYHVNNNILKEKNESDQKTEKLYFWRYDPMVRFPPMPVGCWSIWQENKNSLFSANSGKLNGTPQVRICHGRLILVSSYELNL